MIIPIADFIKLYHFTPGRRIHALRQVREIVVEHELADLLPATDEALTQEAYYAALRSAWGLANAEAETLPSEIDPKIDRTLLLMDQMLGHYADQGGETGRYARRLSASIFPDGVGQHIRLPHVDQHAANAQVLVILEAAERQPWIERLGLRMLTASLRELNDAFGRAVRLREKTGGVTYGEVRDANARCHEMLLEVVARILGRFPTPADGPLRTELLKPIAYQNEAIRLFRRRRRRVVDIDPDTGEPTSPQPGDDVEEVADEDGELVAAPVDGELDGDVDEDGGDLVDDGDTDLSAGSGASI